MRYFLVTAAYEDQENGRWFDSFVMWSERFPEQMAINDACRGRVYSHYKGMTAIIELSNEDVASYEGRG